LPEIKDVLLEFPWTRLLNFAKTPQIRLLTPDKLANIHDSSGELKYAYDITPASLAKFAFDQNMRPNNYYVEL
jgi:hypothetical protein